MIQDTTPPTSQRIRAYFAPVDRTTGTPTPFDPAQPFPPDTPPAPWIDLGWITDFTRTCGTKIEGLIAGTPRSTKLQTRSTLEATVSCRFESWGKLQLALSCGTEQRNLPKPASAALALLAGSNATTLQMDPTDAATLSVGDLLAVDTDYTGTTGYLGSGVSGAFVKTAFSDADFTRRITLNVARIAGIHASAVTLASPLLAAPTAAMKAQPIVGFSDREGSTFFQEGSMVFLAEGQQGERILWHYPRLQSATGITENTTSANGYDSFSLAATFRALPSSEPYLCQRTYFPG